VLGLMLVAPPIAKMALSFSSPEYFALMSLGLALVVLLAGRSIVKALLAALLGLWIASVGTDLFSSTSRFTFGRMELLSESTSSSSPSACSRSPKCSRTWKRARNPAPADAQGTQEPACRRLQDMKDCRFAFVNGSVVGFLVGALPGGGSTIASFLSYGLEKAVSPRRSNSERA